MMMMMMMIMPSETDKPREVADVTRRLTEQRRDLERRNGDPEEERVLLVLFDTFDTLFINHLP